MERDDSLPIQKLGLFRRFCAGVASADPQTLAVCHRRDHDTVSAVAVIMIMTSVYQCALFAAIGNHLFGTPGQFNPIILCVAAFIALFIMRVDAFTIMRSGWHQNGIAELKRGGLDISGGVIDQVKAGILLTVRVTLALGSAQLTAIFTCIFVFFPDIDARIESDNARANAPISLAATTRVDGDIKARGEDIAARKAELANTNAAIAGLRKQENDLMSSEPRLEDAQADIARLNTDKSKAQDEVQAAQTFALNEAAGVKGNPNNTGLIGEGIRYRAASARVANAEARVAEIDASLEAAQGRLDDLTKQFTSRTDAERGQIEEQISGLRKSRDDAQSQLASYETELTERTKNRDATIQTAVHAAADYVPVRTGLLIQIAALRSLADGNPEIAVVILLIEVTSFGLEMAAVLAKVVSFVPTTYAAYLARDAYMGAVSIVDGMAEELDKRALRKAEPEPLPESEPEIANDNEPDFEEPPTVEDVDSGGDEPTPPPQSPKRPRGRPRKVPAE